MFGTGHPRLLHRKEVAMHVLRQEERRLASHTLTVDVPDLVKKRRMPHCAFRIDAGGIERGTRAGTLVRSWADIKGVRHYRRGFLVLYDRGAMPIPFRCLNRDQQVTFRSLAAKASSA